jgi:hypothetical protein
MTNHIHLALQAGKNTFITRFAQFLFPLYSLDKKSKKQDIFEACPQLPHTTKHLTALFTAPTIALTQLD